MERQTLAENFWSNQAKAQGILKEIALEKKWLAESSALERSLGDLETLSELAGSDAELRKEFDEQSDILLTKLDEFETKTLLSERDDPNDAILSIHPGAGGTESQDWAQMLLRLYTRWCERHGYEADLIDYQDGDEAGVKSATLEIRGEYAYGYLKSESGVHRMVRISPFDANQRRHTSFASVFVLPEVGEDIEIEIKPEDIRTDTFRASGAGGQHVNKTSSAVRMTHVPTGIVVQCQTERSQIKNRESALKVLKARLYQRKREEEEKKLEAYTKSKKKIEWGSQIRSYVFHPYNMVKDHRTSHETSDTTRVMDGDIDAFVAAFLNWKDR